MLEQKIKGVLVIKIEIKGPIIDSSEQFIYDWLEIEATSPKKVNELLKKADENEEIEITINSGGGSVFAGSEIYTALKERGNVKGKIVGLAASAASVVAMGVKHLEISPTAQIMIHKASTCAGGNADDIEKTVNALRGIDKSIANAYVLKTGINQEELLDMMQKETWLNAQQAKEIGFADSIMFEDEFKATNSVINNTIPVSIINKIKEKLIEDKKNKIENKTENENELDIAKAKLKLLIL